MEHLKTIETFLKLATAAQAAQDEVVALEADNEKQAEQIKAARDEVATLISDVKVLVNRLAEEQAKRKAAVKECEVAKLQYTKWADESEKDHAHRVTELKDRVHAEKTKCKAAEVQVEIYVKLLDDAENSAAKEISALKALLNAERLKVKTLVGSLTDGMNSFEQMLPFGDVQPAPAPDSPLWVHMHMDGNM